MFDVARIRSVGSILFIVVLGVLSVCLAFAQETKQLSFSYPKTIGDLALDEFTPSSETDRTTYLKYDAPGLTLTLYIWGGHSELADGIDSEQVQREFDQAIEAIQDPRAWKRAKKLHVGTAQLGTAPNQIIAREAVFKVKGEGLKGKSYLYITASNQVLFKVRYTVQRRYRKTGEQHLPDILRSVGNMIETFNVGADGEPPN